MNIARQQSCRAVCVHMGILAMNLQNATMGNFRGKSTQMNMEKLIEVIEMIGLLAVDAVLIFCIIILAIKLWDCSANLDRAEYRIDLRGSEINELKQRCDAYKELIEALSKSVRELNGVVEAAVKVKEQTSDNKPDTKALIGGWATDGAETTWLEDILIKIRKKNEKPIDATHISVGLVDGQSLLVPVRDTGQTLVDGEPIRNGRLWTNSEGRIYELPEGCFISGDKSYEMDQ